MLSEMRTALFLSKKELEYCTLKEDQHTSIYAEYNEIKMEQVPILKEKLDVMAWDIFANISNNIDDWKDKKERKQFHEALDDEDELLLLAILIAVQARADMFKQIELPAQLTYSYDRAAKFYTDKEINKIRNLTGREPAQQYAPRLNWDDPTVKSFYTKYTLVAFRDLGDKYTAIIKRVIEEGYKNNLSIVEIASNLKSALDPTNKGYLADHIYERIARSEIAFITETAKLDGWQSIGIQYAEFVTRRDSKVCIICRSFDGKIFSFKEIGRVVIIPVHPYCRCTWVPIYDPADIGLLFLPFIPDDEI